MTSTSARRPPWPWRTPWPAALTATALTALFGLLTGGYHSTLGWLTLLVGPAVTLLIGPAVTVLCGSTAPEWWRRSDRKTALLIVAVIVWDAAFIWYLLWGLGTRAGMDTAQSLGWPTALVGLDLFAAAMVGTFLARPRPGREG